MHTAIGFTIGFSPVPANWNPRERPQYGKPWDRTHIEWWHNMLHEAWIARADYIAPVIRSENPQGDNPGWSSPLRLTPLVNVVQDALDLKVGAAIHGGENIPLLAPFVDTGAHPWTWAHITTGRFELGVVDLGDPDVWRLFWRHDLAHFFATVPSHQLFRVNGRVLVMFWSVAEALGYRNHEGNLGPMLDRIRVAAREEFGYELFVVPDKTWALLDSTFDESHSEGLHDWFDPPSTFSVRRWNAQAFGVAVPGFIDPSNSGRVIDRRHGAALREAFAAFEDARVSVVLLEGLTDWEESAGFYRSHEWRTAVGQQDAELYLRIVRECGDRLRTEAGVDPAIERILTRIQAIEQQLNQLRNDVLQLREDEARRGRLGLNPPDPPV